MVRRPPRIRWLDTVKSQGHKVEFINEGIDRARRIVFGDPIVQVLRKQYGLI